MPRPKKGERIPGSGRPKGRKNKATIEAKAAASLIVDDPQYRENLLQACRDRTAAPGIEIMLWHYAKGKPKEADQSFNHAVKVMFGGRYKKDE